MITLMQVLNSVQGNITGDINQAVNGISINTRADCKGRLFVALKGDNFDAHEFVKQAQDAGASALLVERDIESTLPTIKVTSTHQALADLSAWWRSQFDIPVIGVTGSVGKTSVKEMLACIFAQTGKGVVTKGNLNNEIGVPITLMNLTEDDHYAVVEMGMNHAGEIARITNMVRPTVALINNAAAAHLEGLGTIEAVADAKAEIFEGLAKDGVAVINNDDCFAPNWLEKTKQFEQLTFALQVQNAEAVEADVIASYQMKGNKLLLSVFYKDSSFEVELNALGEHSVRNALAAITVSFAAGISINHIQAGLRAYRPIAGRLNISHVGNLALIDDTYNANPLSMLAAIKVLVRYTDHVLIVGDMAELGDAAQSEHELLGQYAAQFGVTCLLACGNFAQVVVNSYKQAQQDPGTNNAVAFDEQSELIKYAITNIDSGTALVKGSRSAAMENVVNALTQSLQNATATQRGIH